jgi:tetraacyldisaccharide 4'-kinase
MKTPHFWQTRNLTSAALLPASLLYRMGAWADRTFTTPTRAPLPVIGIGNVTAGGAGKTPTTLALIPLLHALGHTPHILTRGYGGANLRAHRVSVTDDWQQVGDEALLLAAAAPTWVGRDRHACARAAANAGASILVCDDALQHHALHKDLALLILDGPYGIGNGALIPAGPLREPLESALTRSDAAIIIGEDTHGLAARTPLPSFMASIQPTVRIPTLSSEPWIAFAGIGRPEKFFASLRALGANLIDTHAFADHHAYTTQDIERLMNEATQHGARLITTAKDAVKLPPEQRTLIEVLAIELHFADTPAFSEFLAASLAGIALS